MVSTCKPVILRIEMMSLTREHDPVQTAFVDQNVFIRFGPMFVVRHTEIA